jgi:membrane protein DedA with SNARE-associated domain
MADFQWLLEGGSYLGIVLFLIGTGAGLPLPEEVAIIYAGIQSGMGELNPWLALGACFLGAIVGDWVMYAIGRYLGRRWLGRHPWFARFLHVDREIQMRKHVQSHAFKVFFAARFMVGVRGPLYISAGVIRFPFRRFMLIDAVCATLVITLFFGISYFFGSTVLEWIRKGEYLLTGLVVAAAAVAAAVFFVRNRRASRRMLEESPPAAAPEPRVADGQSSMTIGDRAGAASGA